jgi:hypothetical protein
MEEVDLDEQERRRKRAERFGVPIAVRFMMIGPMIHQCLRKLGAGCEGLISFISGPAVDMFFVDTMRL